MLGAEVTVVDSNHGGIATYQCYTGFEISPGVTSITVQCEIDTNNVVVDHWGEPNQTCLGNQA